MCVVSLCFLARLQGGGMEAMTPMTPKSISSASSDSTDLEDDPDVAVVEMLMEPYFMQVGGCEVLWFEQLPKPWVAFVC
jgi:hypothetical protein